MIHFRFFLYFFLASSYSLKSFCCFNSSEGESFLPENKMYIHTGLKNRSGIDKEMFNQILDELEIEFKEEAIDAYPMFEIKKLWDEGTVNAFASGSGVLHFYGGLARHPLMTPESFILVACHEMGHIIGGFPRTTSRYAAKLSPEGQADYFATLKCARRLFSKEYGKKIETKIPDELDRKCLKSHANSKDYNICVRTIVASLKLGEILVSLTPNYGPIELSSKPLPAVNKTHFSYPSNQCRLETFFAGAFCDRSVEEKIQNEDEISGVCHKASGDLIGMRPECWFKSSVY